MQFTLVFTNEAGQPSPMIYDSKILIFRRRTDQLAQDKTYFTTEGITFCPDECDELFSRKTFENASAWYNFELQQVTGMYFLMLQKIKGEEQVYRRIGLASINTRRRGARGVRTIKHI
jgi:hypothetical protein